MNEHRHTTVDALQVKVRELIDTKQELYNAKETIEKRNATIKDMAQQIEFFKNEVTKAKMTIAENEKSHADAQLMLSRQLQDMSNMYDSSQKELRNWI
jgi:chromosome segregation ATPase